MTETAIYEHIIRKLDALSRKMDEVDAKVDSIDEKVTTQLQGGRY